METSNRSRASVQQPKLPADVIVESLLPEGTRYVLPKRNQKTMGLTLLVLALVGLGFSIHWTLMWAEGFRMLLGPLGTLATLVAMPFFLAELAVVAMALSLALGYCELELADGRLTSREWIGPLSWKSWRALGDIRRLVVESRIRGEDNTQTGILAGIRVETDRKPWWIAIGYPRPLLAALATELASRCGESVEASGEAALPVVEVQDISGPAEPSPIERTTQPPGSKIQCNQYPDGLEFIVPARGFWKGPLAWFALLWCGFMTIFSSMFLFVGMEKGHDDGLWIAIAFVFFFWLIGAGLLIAAVNMGRSRASLAVAGDTLMVLTIGIFGSKTNEWPKEQLTAIRVGNSDMTVNDVPLLELQIFSRGQKRFGLLAARDTAELHWIATLLRQSLGVPAHEERDDQETA